MRARAPRPGAARSGAVRARTGRLRPNRARTPDASTAARHETGNDAGNDAVPTGSRGAGADTNAAAKAGAENASGARALPRRITTGRGMLVAMAAIVLFSGIVQGYLTPLLPALGARLHIDGVGQNGIYLLAQAAFAVLTPLLSRLGDLYGHRRLLLAALATVVAGTLLMAARPTQATLAVGVVLQGCVVGFLPLMAGILRHRAPERNRSGIALLVGVLLVAIGLGGLVAGVLSEDRAETGLWTAVPVGLLALCAGLLLPDSGPARGGRFHFGSAALLTVGLAAVVLVLAQGGSWGWAAPVTLGAAAAGLAALAGWAYVEGRAQQPLVSLRLLAGRRLAVVSGCTFCVSFGTIGFLGANATFLGASPRGTGYGMGLGPEAIAAIALAVVAAGFVGSTLTPRLARRVGDRTVLVAAGGLASVGFGAMVALHHTLGEYLACALAVGLATGLFESITRTLSSEVVPEDQTALAVGINELSLSLGAAIGAAVIGALLAAHRETGGPHGAAPHGPAHLQVSGYLWSWGACALIAAVGAALGLCYRGRPGGGADDALAPPASPASSTRPGAPTASPTSTPTTPPTTAGGDA